MADPHSPSFAGTLNPYIAEFDFAPGHISWLSTYLETPSPIAFGYEIDALFVDAFERCAGDRPVDRIFIITDSSLLRLYGHRLIGLIGSRWPNPWVCSLPAGEAAKSFTHLHNLCEELIAQGASKSSVVLSFGGGAVGNIAGVVAALVYRGIRFVEVPTSFTHQTDGTLSNKQAINGARGKNQFGLYYSPMLIWTDTRYLLSEPTQLKNAGIVETVKNALIDQPGLVPFLYSSLRPDACYSPSELTELAYKSICSKLEIIKKDPSEKAYGIVLEYGHTFAHAIEWLADGQLIHGESVAIGMKIAAHLARALGWINDDLLALHYKLIDGCMGLMPSLPDVITSASILEAMQVDNKKAGPGVRYILLDSLGTCRNSHGDYLELADDAIVLRVLDQFLPAYRASQRAAAGLVELPH